MVDDERVLARFSTLFAEGRCFKMSHFLVVRHGEGEAAKYYLKLQMTSIVERIVSYIPRYCFHLVSLPQVITGYADRLGVFGRLFSMTCIFCVCFLYVKLMQVNYCRYFRFFGCML